MNKIFVSNALDDRDKPVLELRSVLKRELPGKAFASLHSAQAGNSLTAFVSSKQASKQASKQGLCF